MAMNNQTDFNNKSYQDVNESEIQLSDIFDMILNHKVWYVISLVVCLTFAVFYLYRSQKTYQRSMKVLVDESNQDATLRNLGVASAGMMRMRGGNSVMNEIEAFNSPDLMQEVVERLGLEAKYVERQHFRNVELYQNSPVEMKLAGDNPVSSFSLRIRNLGNGKVALSEFKLRGEELESVVEGKLGDSIQTPAGILVIYPKSNIDDFKYDITVSWANSMARAKAYCAGLNISLVGKETTVINMTHKDHFPQRSSAILTALVDVYNETWVSNKNKSSVNTSEFISERLVVIEQELSTVEDALKKYKETNNLSDMQASAQAYISESSQYSKLAFDINNKLTIANYIKEYLNDPANSMSLIPSNLGLDNTSIDSQISEYNSIVLKRDRLASASSESNPIVADLNSLVSSLRVAILSSVENAIATLELQKGKIESQEKQILSRISASSGVELGLLSIERQQKIISELYMFLLQKREENELAALVNVGNTRVLMLPNGSDAPIDPNTKMILLVALVLGMGMPFGYFFLRKMLDTTVKTRDDLKRVSMPILAEIPKVQSIMGRSKLLPFKYNTEDSVVKLLVKQGNRDVVNEAYRVLRTNIDLMLGANKGSKVIMLTSFNPGSGKTLTSLNIAATMALKDAKVLLVDLDLRKGTLTSALNISHSGLSSYLYAQTDNIKSNIDEIEHNLHFLPIGALPTNPAELLLSERFAKFVEMVKTEYDYVFFDCPPIDLVVDSTIISEYVDMTLFVARAGLFDKRSIPYLENLYESKKYKSMSMILNAVDVRARRYSYGYGYGYGYGYAYGYGYGNSK